MDNFLLEFFLLNFLNQLGVTAYQNEGLLNILVLKFDNIEEEKTHVQD